MKTTGLLAVLTALLLSSCAAPEAQPTHTNPESSATSQNPAATPTVPAAAASAPVVAAVQAKPFKEAVADATTALLAGLPAEMQSRVLVIDPLLDGVTAEQNRATQGVEQLVKQQLQAGGKKLKLQPLSVESLQRKPLLLIGTFTGLNDQGQTSGARVSYRICLALADTASGVVIAKGVARATTDGVDATPLAYFNDAPAWSTDTVTDGYIRSCQGTRPGEAMDAHYRARLIAGASVNHAVEAYNAGRYQRALDFYAIAMRAAAGDELRILNGVYLANWKLKRQKAAQLIIQRIVGFGLAKKRMAIKFLFQPGSLSFLKDPDFLAAYPLWMKELAAQTSRSQACMNVLGHSSRGMPDNADVGLSQERAQFVRHLLIEQSPTLETRIKALGRGAQDNLVGNGRNDISDVLDRRVVFQVVDCAAGAAI